MYRLILLSAAIAVASARNVDPRIIGGKPASINDYPHQVSLNEDGRGFYCGGSLVNTQHVVTAAHCAIWKEPKKIRVRVGASYRLVGGDPLGVESLKEHQNFSLYYMDYDIAVVKLLKPVKISPSVSPISLVPVKDKRYTGEMLTATGWGMTAYERSKSPDETILQVVHIAVTDLELCKKAHSHWMNKFKVTERVFCAGGKRDQGTYKGDSGGPIINQKKQLVGVVSWGHSGNTTGYPGIFVDLTVPVIRDFVDKNIK